MRPSAASVASGQATTGGGISSTFGYPENSTFTYPLWLYVVGFRYNALGYASRRVPEISDDLVSIDRATRWVFQD